jgi:signal transduction histidine kinase
MNFILRISDSGPGIEEGDTKLIFESFGQSNTYQQEGTGLGLTITKNLTNLLNGTIILRSTPGVGSEFEVTIPVKKCDHIPFQTTVPPCITSPVQKSDPIPF